MWGGGTGVRLSRMRYIHGRGVTCVTLFLHIAGDVALSTVDDKKKKKKKKKKKVIGRFSLL
jgi:hypothetical protein